MIWRSCWAGLGGYRSGPGGNGIQCVTLAIVLVPFEKQKPPDLQRFGTRLAIQTLCGVATRTKFFQSGIFSFMSIQELFIKALSKEESHSKCRREAKRRKSRVVRNLLGLLRTSNNTYVGLQSHQRDSAREVRSFWGMIKPGRPGVTLKMVDFLDSELAEFGSVISEMKASFHQNPIHENRPCGSAKKRFSSRGTLVVA